MVTNFDYKLVTMARYQFEPNGTDQPKQEHSSTMKETDKVSTRATDFMSFFVRILGVFMLLVGLWMGVKVITEVWALYRGPHHIERFADSIDKGSNLDKVLANFSSSRSKGKNDPQAKANKKSGESLRVSYFLAWIIVIFLLMLIGRLAMLAIKTGGELALYDLQVKKFARQLSEEVQSLKQ